MGTKELIERFYYSGWNRRDESVFHECIDANVKFRGALPRAAFSNHKRVSGIANLMQYTRSLNAAIPNYKIEIEQLVVSADEGTASTRLTCRGFTRARSSAWKAPDTRCRGTVLPSSRSSTTKSPIFGFWVMLTASRTRLALQWMPWPLPNKEVGNSNKY
jgi:SnoaL-like domain